MSLFILVFIGVFTATAFAAGAAMPEDANIADLLRPVYDAFVHGNKLYAGMLALIAMVALLKRYAPAKWRPFLYGDIGGSLLTLTGSFAGAMATTLGSGNPVSWMMVKTAGLIAVGAAGGYALVKKLLIEPLLRPWSSKAPAWLRPLLAMVLWIFDKPSPIAKAEAAGNAAVAAKPPTGMEGVVGKTRDVE
jgi:hypothetical protein